MSLVQNSYKSAKQMFFLKKKQQNITTKYHHFHHKINTTNNHNQEKQNTNRLQKQNQRERRRKQGNEREDEKTIAKRRRRRTRPHRHLRLPLNHLAPTVAATSAAGPPSRNASFPLRRSTTSPYLLSLFLSVVLLALCFHLLLFYFVCFIQ
jgi:hypothetical protein